MGRLEDWLGVTAGQTDAGQDGNVAALVAKVRAEMRPNWRVTPGGLKWSPGNDALKELAALAKVAAKEHDCEACGKYATECLPSISPEDGDLWFCEPCLTALRSEAAS